MRVSQGQEFVIAGYTPSANNFDAIIFGWGSLHSNLNHTEKIAVWIFQHNKVIVRLMLPGITDCPDSD